MRQFNSSRFHAVVRNAGLYALVLLVTLANMTAPAQVRETTGVSIKNFGKVSEQYYRGSQPTEAEFWQLKQLGIKTVIDLRKDSKREESGWAKSAGMRYVNIPLEASRAATVEQTNYFLSLVNDPANWPVYVHCKGGRHRTGALTAVYRITRDGWTADQAFQEMEQYDFNHGFFGGPSAQKRFVYSYYERYRLENDKGSKQ